MPGGRRIPDAPDAMMPGVKALSNHSHRDWVPRCRAPLSVHGFQEFAKASAAWLRHHETSSEEGKS
jgi:hypothetical protein